MGFALKKFGLVLLAASSAFAALAGAAKSEDFKGSFCLIAANAACIPFGHREGQCMSARISLPANDGDSLTRLSVFWPYRSKTFTVAGETLNGDVFKTADTAFVDKEIWSDEASIRIVEQDPPTVDLNSRQVSVTGDITGFEQSCFVRFRFLGQADTTSPGVKPAVGDEEANDGFFSNSGSSYLRTIDPESN